MTRILYYLPYHTVTQYYAYVYLLFSSCYSRGLISPQLLYYNTLNTVLVAPCSLQLLEYQFW